MKDEKIQPLSDRVVIKRIEAEEKTPAGIILPNSATEKSEFGVVEAVGPGATQNDGKLKPMHVKVGNKVVFGKYAGQTVKLGDTEYLIIREDEILAIMH